MPTEDEIRRYSRQIALPEIGAEGQHRLAAGRLLRFSGLTMEFSMLQIDRNPICPVCGELQHPAKP